MFGYIATCSWMHFLDSHSLGFWNVRKKNIFSLKKTSQKNLFNFRSIVIISHDFLNVWND